MTSVRIRELTREEHLERTLFLAEFALGLAKHALKTCQTDTAGVQEYDAKACALALFNMVDPTLLDIQEKAIGLRLMTGHPQMRCKIALTNQDGDLYAAAQYLKSDHWKKYCI
jgi:hypothetical protein